MKRFKSARQCQRFVSIHGPITNLFHYPRSSMTAAQQRHLPNAAVAMWNQITMTTAA